MDSNINKLDVTNYIDVSDIKCDELGLPIANIGNIKELRYGLRPATEKKIPQVYVEKKKNKIVSHNYGHSGAGWTYLFGSVSRSIANFEEYINKNIIEKENNYKTLLEFKEKEQVAVVGMGCIGLTTALYLIEKGYKNIKLIGAEKDYITSHVAGGLFAIPPAITIDNENDKLKIIF